MNLQDNYNQYQTRQTESQGIETNTFARQLTQQQPLYPVSSQLPSILPNLNFFTESGNTLGHQVNGQPQYQGNTRSTFTSINTFGQDRQTLNLQSLGSSADQTFQFSYQPTLGHISLPNTLDYSSYVGRYSATNQQLSQQHPHIVDQFNDQARKQHIYSTKVPGRSSFAQTKISELSYPINYDQQKGEFNQVSPLMPMREFSISPDVFGDPLTNTNRMTSKNHFKPTQTKRNSKPRINKLNKSKSFLYKLNKKRKKRPKFFSTVNTMAELSTDDLFQHFQDTLKIEKPDGSQKASFYLKMKSEMERQLFDIFVNHLSRSIDVFLPQEVFQKIIPELALYDETNMIIYSIFCLSSLMLQRINPNRFDLSITIKYYNQTITSIRYYLSIPGIEENDKGIMPRCLLSTLLLCIYELFFVEIDRTYIKGASSILSSILMKNNVNKSVLKSSPFYRTCFWPVLLCDLMFSLKYNSPSMYSIDQFWKPLDPEYFELYEDFHNFSTPKNESHSELAKLTTSKIGTMWWLHKSIINYSSITEFKNKISVLTKEEFESNQPYLEWLDLKKYLDNFEKNMPLTIKPTIYKSISAKRLFPIIYFKDEATAIIGLNYKLAKIALYEALIQKANLSDYSALVELLKFPKSYPVKLAKDIVGIIKTYDTTLSIWTVNAHAIRCIAHYLQDEPNTFKVIEELLERPMAFRQLHL